MLKRVLAVLFSSFSTCFFTKAFVSFCVGDFFSDRGVCILVKLGTFDFAIVAGVEEQGRVSPDSDDSDGESGIVEDPQYKEARGALRAFQRCDYGTAVKRFTQVLVQGNQFRPKLLLKRAESFYKLELHAEALKDLECILGVDPDHFLAINLKAKVLFACHQFEAARSTFLDLKKRLEKSGEPDLLGLKQYLIFCEERIARIEKQKEQKVAVQQEAERKAEAEEAKSVEMASEAAKAAANLQPPKAPAAKIRHEWYQTDQTVVVTVLAKGLIKDWVQVDTSSRKLKLEMNFADDKRVMEFDLFRPVAEKETSFKVTPSKIEIKMQKTEAVHWSTLEAPPEAVAAAALARPAYPSSAKNKHNWDALEQEVKKQEAEEKLEGDGALQKVFADIYANASDETKRAMNKSYLESGGTVLSTNWSSVKEAKVDMKPPDGMEFKKWE